MMQKERIAVVCSGPDQDGRVNFHPQIRAAFPDTPLLVIDPRLSSPNLTRAVRQSCGVIFQDGVNPHPFWIGETSNPDYGDLRFAYGLTVLEVLNMAAQMDMPVLNTSGREQHIELFQGIKAANSLTMLGKAVGKLTCITNQDDVRIFGSDRLHEVFAREVATAKKSESSSQTTESEPKKNKRARHIQVTRHSICGRARNPSTISFSASSRLIPRLCR